MGSRSANADDAATGVVTIGVDLGGTKVEAAVVTSSGEIVGGSRQATGAERGPEGVLAALTACVLDGCLPELSNSVAAVGIGVAGQVDPGTGTVLHAPNLRWDDFPLQARLRERLDMPVFVLNDVQAATYGEWTHGVGQGVDDLVTLFVGTGVGGGVISGGRLLRGCSGSGGELGHITIDLHGPPCSCPNHGCLEAFAGGWAIARRAQELVAAEPQEGAALLRLAGGEAQAITAATVSQAAHAGDPLGRRLVQEVAEALGAGVASIANAFNPCLIILGGGVTDGLPGLVDLVRQQIKARALAVALRPLEIVRPALGKHAGTVGAAAWARHNVE